MFNGIVFLENIKYFCGRKFKSNTYENFIIKKIDA